MVRKPVVFISSTSDLRSARDLVGKVLYSMGYEPVWQDIEATDGGELLGVLRKRLDPCDLVIQLVGQRFGAEPPAPTPEFGRVSYTQFEALYAERLGRKVVYYFIDPAFPTDPAAAESDERQSLQVAYRRGIEAANKLRQSNVGSTQDLELSIRRITDELAAVRSQSDRRFRRMSWLAGSAALGIVLVAGLALAVLRGQAKQERDLAAITARLGVEVAPKPLPAGQAAPNPLSPELLEQARLLLARGNEEQRALAQIALRQHAAADSMIQDLKRKPGNPIDEAFRLLTLEGSNWYQAGEPDRAIAPFEQALALRPNDVEARNRAMIARGSARQGNIAANQARAIAIAESTLKLAKPGSVEWARTQGNLGLAWLAMPTGDKEANVRRAIAAEDAALTVLTRSRDPDGWAALQGNLSQAWLEMPTGDRATNVRKAIAAADAVLTVRTRAKDPVAWARAQINLGNAWRVMPTGDRTVNLRKAITAYDAALTVLTREANADDWATVQLNLGLAWVEMPTGDRTENVRKAIAAQEAALTVFTRTADPALWAAAQLNLGNSWQEMPNGDPVGNLRKAIAAYEAALTVSTKDAHPGEWAKTQSALGNAWSNMPEGDPAANQQKAIAAHEAALSVWTREGAPADWARTQLNLGAAWARMPAADRSATLRKAIAAFEAALGVFTREAAPNEWAVTQVNIGTAWELMPGGDRRANLGHAIAAYEAALTVYPMSRDPQRALAIRTNLSWYQLLAGDFKGAASTAEGASAFIRQNRSLEVNYAHALLFLNRTDQAKAIYLSHVGETIGDRTWQAIVLQDFADLEKAGWANPQFDLIRDLLEHPPR